MEARCCSLQNVEGKINRRSPQTSNLGDRMNLQPVTQLSEWIAVDREISDRDFHLFQVLVYGESGVWLSEAKKALLCGRLAKRLRFLSVKSLRDYYKLVLTDPEERVQMINLLCTHETQFFREAHHFEFLARQVIPAWKQEAARGERPRRINVWSAGCSTGEEPYSIAMLLLDHFPRKSGWEVKIAATDISTRALERAH